LRSVVMPSVMIRTMYKTAARPPIPHHMASP